MQTVMKNGLIVVRDKDSLLEAIRQRFLFFYEAFSSLDLGLASIVPVVAI